LYNISKLHNPKYKIVFHIIKFGLDNYRIVENIRLQEEIIGIQKEIFGFLGYADQSAPPSTWFARAVGYSGADLSGSAG